MHDRHTNRLSLGLAGLSILAGTTIGLAQQARPDTTPETTPPEASAVKIVDDQGNEVAQFDLAGLAAQFAGRASAAGDGNDKPLPSWKDVTKGFDKVVSTTDGRSLFNVWINRETNEILAELPRGYERQNHFIATTVSGGEIFAGLQAADYYVNWKRFGKDRLALIRPQLQVRASGEPGAQDSVDRIFTDRVLVDIPIKAMGPNGQPMIDLDDLLVGNADTFFGPRARGLNRRLAEVTNLKAFPENVEVAFKVPDATGTFKAFHYSLSLIQGTPGYKPRMADERLGYFVTSFEDYGKVERDDVYVRYINRWNLEKADPRLALSPPKEPIVYYVEHTVPIRYRRFVRDGIEYWNTAFRNVGIDGAIEVRYQDKTTGAHMDKDPEDVRYNFIRWLNNDISTAIGPSRVNPMTGEILDADVVLTDGWLRTFTSRWDNLIPDLAADGYDPETLEWFEQNPRWDPRVRLASPRDRAKVMQGIQARAGITAYGGHPIATADAKLLGDDEYDGLIGRTSQVSGFCTASSGLRHSLEMGALHFQAMGAVGDLILLAHELGPDSDKDVAKIMQELTPEMIEQIKKRLAENPDLINFIPPEYREQLMAALGQEEEQPEEEMEETEGEEDAIEDKPKSRVARGRNGPITKGDLIDGMPESYVGPALAELVAHEVGHTLGLRHNFKGSSAYSLEEINSDEFKGKKAWSATVMDYNGINIRVPGDDAPVGDVQGDFSSIDLGPYDMWVIEYGYTFGDTDKVLERVAEPELAYGTDEDSSGPDPTVRRYDLSADPIEWGRNQMRLAQLIRESLLEDFVKDGESWGKTRQGYFTALREHQRVVTTAIGWVGGAYVYRDKKGDPNARTPVQPVDADKQREALDFVISNVFYDDAFGLNAELLRHMTVDKWFDRGGSVDDSMFQVHDRVLGVQASVLSGLMNPTKLRRVYDNEFLVDENDDALTMAEMMGEITENIWSEIDARPRTSGYSNRDPMVSSIRRNLQREHLERLIDLTLPETVSGAAANPIRTLAVMHLREIGEKASKAADSNGKLDDYTKAHLLEVADRCEQALDPQFIYNQPSVNFNLGALLGLFGQDEDGNN
ncbi:MAG: zinc-dependent metalloprotease [Planctomycetota bacterium]